MRLKDHPGSETEMNHARCYPYYWRPRSLVTKDHLPGTLAVT